MEQPADSPMDKHLMRLDDGKFYIEHNCNGEAATTNGFLLRRCLISPTTLGAYECVGGCERCTAGNGGRRLMRGMTKQPAATAGSWPL